MGFNNDRSVWVAPTWAEFKKFLDGTRASLTFFYEEKTSDYRIVTETYGGVRIEFDLIRDGGSDVLDFENNYKTANRPLAAAPSPTVDPYNELTMSSSSSGDTELITPASGKTVRLHYLSLNADGSNGADVTAAIRFGPAGALRYTKSLKPGSIFARNIGAGRHSIDGAIDEKLYLVLSVAQTVHVDLEYEII